MTIASITLPIRLAFEPNRTSKEQLELIYMQLKPDDIVPIQRPVSQAIPTKKRSQNRGNS